MVWRKVTPSFSAIAWDSRIMVAASFRVLGNWQISTRVAWVSALIGLKERLPQAFSQISERMSARMRDRKPALTRASCSRCTRSLSDPSSSPIGKRSPSTWWITPGSGTSAAG